ncbi:MAG: 1-phosphofructokinase family hexose kinase [Erysipelotrichaceae bacterium]|nr:1-phosphofructokinase family hexose kinase [Erysipelotrichaceae bacterium]
MIYTCTSNPSLDYYVTLDEISIDKLNRSHMEMYDAGGKGVNVSVVLNNFQITNVALGFLGGFTKDFYLSILSKYPNIQPLFTTIKDNTRINIKVMSDVHETSINAKGPHITKQEFTNFKNRLLSIYDGDYFVLSGNIEEDIKDDIVETIHELAKENVKIVLDSDADIMDRCVDVKPYLVKLNRSYLNATGKDREDAMEEMISKGAKYVMYSSRDESSYLYSADEKYMSESIQGSLVNITGSSDSMVAGFLYASLRGANTIEKFSYAVAASIATTHSNDLCSRDKVEEVIDQIKVSKL